MREKHDLGALGVLVHLGHIGAHAIVGSVVLPRHLFLRRNHRLGAAEVDDDRALLEATDDAVHDLVGAVLVFLEDGVAFGLANALDDHLLRGLGEDATEARRVDLHADLVAHLRIGVEGLRVDRD